MKLEAVLTTGWNDDPQAPFAARRLDDLASRDMARYADRIGAELDSGKVTGISGLEQVFRRRTGGFEAIKRFVAVLLSIPAKAAGDPLPCRIDAFAYAFLAGAKNFDLIAPPAKQGNEPFRATLVEWRSEIAALDRFERTGHPLPEGPVVTQEVYLSVRRIIARRNVRHERKVLALLLLSGPSTTTQISDDLGLSITMIDRILAPFESAGMVVRRDNAAYAIADPYLPVTLFGLRETLGLDPITILRKLLD